MRADTEKQFDIPSPSEVFLLVAAGWTGLCVLAFLSGDKFVRRVSQLSGQVRSLLEDQDLLTVLPVLLVVGILGIALVFSVFSRWEKLFIVSLFVSFSFADSTWDAGHLIAFVIKYMGIIYLGAFGIFFALRNWNRFDKPVHWLAIAQILWLAVSVIYYGGRINDIWYLGTQFTLVFAFGVGWMSRVDTSEKLMEFSVLLAYIAIGVTFLHMLSPILAPNVFDGGRFVSQFSNATGFATTYVLFLISIVWLTLAHPNPAIRRFAVLVLLCGAAMILLSGTRNASAALVCAIIFLSFSLKSKLFIYALSVGGFFAVVGFLFVGDTETADILSRMTNKLSADGSALSRVQLWLRYLESTFVHPIIGWGADGQTGAYYGARAQAFAEARTSRGFAPGVHNAMLGQTVRFGYVGLVLFLAMFVYAFARAKQIIFNKGIPASIKLAYSLPVAILVTLFLEGAFEDNFATPRGSVVNVLYGTMVILVVIFADKLSAQLASGDFTPEELEEVKPPEPPKKLVRI